MTFLQEIERVVNSAARGGWAETFEASITGLGDVATRYQIQKRSGQTIPNVDGPAGISPGARCTVAKYRSGKLTILTAQAGNRPGIITTVSV